jgi:hypothetical protein
MIRALESAPLEIELPEVSDEERAANIATNAEFKKNVAWWNAHAAEIVPQNLGKFVCVAGQELFVGDDAAEVVARATAAHSNPGRGFFTTRISTHQGPMIHAIRGALGARGREHPAPDDLRRS